MKKLYLTTALTLLACPVLADITPEELWESWQATMADMGASLTAGQQERQGAVLVFHDVKTSVDTGYFNIEQVIDIMRLEALADGSVAVSYDSDFGGGGTATFPEAPTSNITLSGDYSGTHGIVTGSANDYVYDFTIAAMNMTSVSGLSDDLESQTGVLTRATSDNKFSDMSGQIHFTQTSAGMNMSYSFLIGKAIGSQDTITELGGQNPQIKQSQNSSVEGYSGDISLFLPHADPNAESGRFLRMGLTLDARLAIEAFNLTQKTASPYLNMDVIFSQGSSNYGVSIDSDSASLSGQGDAMEIEVNSSGFGPQPYRVAIAENALAMSVPLYPDDALQEARYMVYLGGVTVNDTIWAIADPAGTLSHAPADFTLDASAAVQLLLDWTNFDTVKTWQGPPAILNSVKLQDFLVAFENARLTGQGEVQFSNDGPDPVPNGGQLNFNFSGVIALLDKLGSLPLVDPSITAGAKGMLGVFATSNGSDNLTSRIEFTHGGHISVNGQQVK